MMNKTYIVVPKEFGECEVVSEFGQTLKEGEQIISLIPGGGASSGGGKTIETEEVKKIAPWNDPDVIWVCEDHPTKKQSHRVGIFRRECEGAGMPKQEKESLPEEDVLDVPW